MPFKFKSDLLWKTIQFLEDTTGGHLEGLGYGDDFLDTTPKVWSVKEIIDKLDFIKIKNFSFKKDQVNRMIGQVTD